MELLEKTFRGMRSLIDVYGEVHAQVIQIAQDIGRVDVCLLLGRLRLVG